MNLGPLLKRVQSYSCPSRYGLVGLIVVVSSVELTGCRHSPRTPEEDFALLFEGFRLAWIANATDSHIIEDGELSRADRLPLRPALVAGMAYGLYNDHNVGSETLALDVLPNRLRRISHEW